MDDDAGGFFPPIIPRANKLANRVIFDLSAVLKAPLSSAFPGCKSILWSAGSGYFRKP